MSKAPRVFVTLAVLALLLLSGCVTTYEGASDYRFAAVNAAQKVEFVDKFEPSATTRGAQFKQHDPLSIYLKNAYFVWCPPHWFEQISASVSQRKPKCRVAVVANVGSRLEQVADRSASDSPGRIVFYSRDVQPSQFINQSQGLLYSTSSWDGNDITLDVTVLEMATEDTRQADEVLKALATLGTSSALSAGGQQVVGALNTVGSAFVRASAKDAVIGQYRFTLVRPNTGSAAHVATLQEGDLVLVRARDEERETIDWANYVYDPTVGKLFERVKGGSSIEQLCDRMKLPSEDAARVAKLDQLGQPKCYIEAHHRNYLVFSFVKAAAPTDWIPTTTHATLQAAIQTGPSAIQQAANTIANAAIQRSNLHQAREAIRKIKLTTTPAAVKAYESQRLATITQCGYLNTLTSIADGLAQVATANCGGTAWRSRTLTTSEFEYIAQQLVGCNVGVTSQSLLGDPGDGTKAADARKALAEAISKATTCS